MSELRFNWFQYRFSIWEWENHNPKIGKIKGSPQIGFLQGCFEGDILRNRMEGAGRYRLVSLGEIIAQMGWNDVDESLNVWFLEHSRFPEWFLEIRWKRKKIRSWHQKPLCKDRMSCSKFNGLQVTTNGVIKYSSLTTHPGSETYNHWRFEDTHCSWISHTCPVDENFIVKLTEPHMVYGVALKGRTDADQWITKFTVETSRNGLDWDSQGAFLGCTDRNTPTLCYFKEPVAPAYIKFCHLTKNTGGHFCARFGLIIPK